MLRVIIVEDEEPILRLMGQTISANKNLDVVGKFTSSKKALESMKNLKLDVAFIDIELPGMNGIELAESIKNFNEDIQIVFTTAYEEYAVNAFRVNAIDYLLKPITEQQINRTTQRLLKNYSLLSYRPKENNQNRILCINEFKVYGYNNYVVKWPTLKVEELFAYFVYNKNSYIDKWTLCDILWTDWLPKKAEHNLHTTIYRLKNALKEAGINNVISYQQGAYKADLSGFYIDFIEFEDYLKNDVVIDKHNVDKIEDVLLLFKGTLFENKSYIWSIEGAEKISRKYTDTLKKLASYYLDMKNYNNAEEWLRKALIASPFDEEAHELIMKTYFLIGSRSKLHKHYKKIQQLFNDELNIPIQNSIKLLFEKLISKL